MIESARFEIAVRVLPRVPRVTALVFKTLSVLIWLRLLSADRAFDIGSGFALWLLRQARRIAPTRPH